MLTHPQGHLVLLQAGQPTIHLLSNVWRGLSRFPWEPAVVFCYYKKYAVILKLTEVLCTKKKDFSMRFPAHSITPSS